MMHISNSNLEDVLDIIQDIDLPILQDMYKNVGVDMIHIYNYLSSVVRWKTLHSGSKYFTIYIAKNWRTTGTFIGVNQYYCNELFIGTLEDGCETLSSVLCRTKHLDWTKPLMVYSLYSKLYLSVTKALADTCYDLGSAGCANIWLAKKDKAVDLSAKCPDEVYISELKLEHAKIINAVWPPRYIDSQHYLESLIEINGGYGVFLRNSNQLLAWAIHNLIGLGAIQTLYPKKGYGTLITAYLAQKIAENGFDPLGTVRQGNVPSEKMFTKLGFEVVGQAYFINNKAMDELESAARR